MKIAYYAKLLLKRYVLRSKTAVNCYDCGRLFDTLEVGGTGLSVRKIGSVEWFSCSRCPECTYERNYWREYDLHD